MVYWKDEPWAHVDPLIALIEEVYTRAIEAGKIATPMDTTVRKIFQYRGWCSAVKEADVRREAENLELVYVPQGLGPGPGLCFPIRDLSGEIMRLHIRLLGDSVTNFKMKYMSLVDNEAFLGPAWIGLDEETIAGIIRTGNLLIVEGPLDLLAVRVAGCPIPSLSPTSKKLTDDHWAALRVYLTKHIYTLMDNEASEIGAKAANYMSHNPYGIEVTTLTCPAKDPAKALTTYTGLALLQDTFPGNRHLASFGDI